MKKTSTTKYFGCVHFASLGAELASEKQTHFSGKTSNYFKVSLAEPNARTHSRQAFSVQTVCQTWKSLDNKRQVGQTATFQKIYCSLWHCHTHSRDGHEQDKVFFSLFNVVTGTRGLGCGRRGSPQVCSEKQTMSVKFQQHPHPQKQNVDEVCLMHRSQIFLRTAREIPVTIIFASKSSQARPCFRGLQTPPFAMGALATRVS